MKETLWEGEISIPWSKPKGIIASVDNNPKYPPHEHKDAGLRCLVAHKNAYSCWKCSICHEWIPRPR